MIGAKTLAVIIAGSLLVASTVPSEPDPRMPQVQQLLEDTYKITNQRPGQDPAVKFVDQQYLNSIICRENPSCSVGLVVAMYINDVIYLRDTWDPNDDWTASYLVHEAVHYLQDQQGLIDRAKDCDSAWQLEYRAYQTQNRWLQQRSKFINQNTILQLTTLSAGCYPTAFTD